MSVQTLSAAQSNKEARINEINLSGALAYLFGRDVSVSGLSLKVQGGNSFANGHTVRWGAVLPTDTTVTLTDNTTNYIVAKKSDGVISSATATTNWLNTTDYARVGVATTLAGVTTAYADHRVGEFGTHQAGSGGGGGGSSSFITLTDTPSAYTGKAGLPVMVNAAATGLEFLDAPAAKSASFTFALADLKYTSRTSSATAMTATIPPNSTVAFPIGSILPLRQGGDGAVSVVAGAGVTINSAAGLDLAGKTAIVMAEKVGTNEWDLTGELAGYYSGLAENLWINSDFGINQRALTSVADGAYCLDRTYVLTETGNVTVSQLAQPTDGIPYALRLTQPDVTAKRIGAAQVIEARNSFAYRGGQLVFAPKLRLSASANLRVALLAWTGTADAPTKDVVLSWASGTYTAGNFFLASNLSVIAVGSVAAVANTWTDLPISSASAGGINVPSTANNLYFMYWTESTVAQSVTLDASIMRTGPGSRVPIWTPPDSQKEAARCERYYGLYGRGISGITVNTTAATMGFTFRQAMRTAPTLIQLVGSPSLRIGGSTSSIAGSFVSSGTDTRGAAVAFTRTSGTHTAGLGFDVNDTSVIATDSEF